MYKKVTILYKFEKKLAYNFLKVQKGRCKQYIDIRYGLILICNGN